MGTDGSLIFDTQIDRSGFDTGMKELDQVARNGIALIAGSFAAIGVAAGKALGAATQQGADFEAAMAQVAATMGKTVDEISELTQVAKEMGASTKFSATEAAYALNYLALAGFDARQQMEALPVVLDLAAAGNMDLAYASDLVTDSMSALGLTTQDMTGFADQMAKTASKANTNVAQLGEAILVTGGQAKMAGLDTVELNTALGILADNGIKGAEGGTALRNTLKNLYTPTSGAAKQLEALGVSTANADGSLRGIQAVLMDLNASLSGLTEEERMGAMANIFDTRTIAAANALLKDSGDRFTELSVAIGDSMGAAVAMASTQLDNLKGDITILESELEGLGVSAYNAFSGNLRNGIQSLTELVADLTEAFDRRGLKGALDVIEQRLPVVTGLIKGLAAGFAALLILRTVTKATTALTAATTALSVAEMGGLVGANLLTLSIGALTGKVSLATVATALFNKTLLANPVVAVAAGVGVLVGALTGMDAILRRTRPELYELSNAVTETEKGMRELTASVKEADQAYQDSVDDMEQQAVKAQLLSDRLYGLSAAYTGTVGEQRAMQQICDSLNGILGEGTVAFDAQTGAINMTKDALTQLIGEMKETARMQALQNRLTAAYEEQADAAYNLYRAQGNYNRMLAEGGSVFTRSKVISDLNKAKEAAATADQKVSSLEGSMEDLGAVAGETAIALEGTAEGLEEVSQAQERVLIGGYDLTDLLEQQGISAEEAQERFTNYADAATNAFDKLSEKSKVTAKSMTQTLEHNTQVMENWSENIAAIGDRLPSDLMQPIIDAGPAEMAGVVANLAKASDGELAALSEAFSNAGSSAVQAFLASFGAGEGEGAEEGGINPLETIAATMQDSTAMQEAGAAAVADTKAAMDAAALSAGFDLLGSEIANMVLTAFTAKQGEFTDAGAQLMNGFISGMESKRSAVMAKAKSIANAAVSAIRKALRIASPSKVTFALGEFTGEGFAKGLGSMVSQVNRAAQNLTGVFTNRQVTSPATKAPAPAAGRTTNVIQNIYAEKQTPAQMLSEAIWLQERAEMMGV